MLFTKGDTVLFTGDSITDCGRARPVGKHGGLGGGYVSILDRYIQERVPDNGLRILNTGIGGHKVTDLAARWQTDVIDLKPDWLSIFVGINDVYHQFSRGRVEVGPELYRGTYEQLIGAVLPSLKGLILATPYLLETDMQDPIRVRMDQYAVIVRDLARTYGAGLVETQKAFDVFMQANPGTMLAEDRVHPNRTGHTIIADAFAEVLEITD